MIALVSSLHGVIAQLVLGNEQLVQPALIGDEIHERFMDQILPINH
jgi:phage-related protein